MAVPVASMKLRARNRSSCPPRAARTSIETIVSPSVSTATSRCPKKTAALGSAARRSAATMSPSGRRAVSSTTSAPLTPRGGMPISLLVFPPRTGRSWISATRSPRRADVSAAAHPDTPPPTTTTSKSPASTGSSGRPRRRRRHRRASASTDAGGTVPSALRKIASHRPSKPVWSWRPNVASPAGRSTAPARSHTQSSSPLAPNSEASIAPLIDTRNRPGWPDGAQSFVRTHTS